MIRHVAGIAEIVVDLEAAITFYRDVLKLDVEPEVNGGYASVHVPGVLHFGLWEQRHAANAIYGDSSAVERVPLGFTVGLEVDTVDQAVLEFERCGLNVLGAPKDAPWGQRVVRFASPSGDISELSETPDRRKIVTDVTAGSGR